MDALHDGGYPHSSFAVSEVKDKDDPHLRAQQDFHALRDTLAKNEKGAVLPTHANLILILKGDPLLQRLVEYNAFSGRHMLKRSIPVLNAAIRKSPGPYPRPWDSEDVTRLLAYVQQAWAHSFRKATVEECLLSEGRDNEVHPVRNYLASLTWDGTARLDRWLTMTFGCALDAYHAAVGSKLLVAAVRRVQQPGCKFDYMPVLEGPQGIGKSSSIQLLFSSEWTADRISDLSSKDAAIDICGKWCAELPEIEQLIRADVETAKAFLSRATDHYRPPYGRVAIDVPRQCVLVGTTNASEYLRDATGNRRFWPIKCLSAEAADLVWLAENRDQLWAEAAHREAAGEAIFLQDATVQRVATTAQAERLSEDPWESKVRNYLLGRPTVTTPEILEHALAVPTAQQTRPLEMRVAAILRQSGWIKNAAWDANQRKTVKIWSRPANA